MLTANGLHGKETGVQFPADGRRFIFSTASKTGTEARQASLAVGSKGSVTRVKRAAR
jgi:hypothetical protein